MRPTASRIKGLGFVLWHARHELYHILLGLVWAWLLREMWGEFNVRWIILAVVGSLAPDLDHLVYFWGYGKGDDYTLQIKDLLKSRQWRALTVFIEEGHKKNTNLSSHNLYFMLILLGLGLLSSLYSWEVGVIVFGAMLIHYMFDIGDDILRLGAVNSNWRRWGRGRK